MENLYLTIKRETLILEHVSFILPLSYLPITAGFSLIKWLRKRSLRNPTLTNEQLQEAIFTCHVWGRRDPRLAPADAGCATRAAEPVKRSRLGKVARSGSGESSVTASHLTAGCLCHCPFLTRCWPHWGHTGGCANISLGWVAEKKKKKPVIFAAVTSRSIRRVCVAGQRRRLGSSPCFS